MVRAAGRACQGIRQDDLILRPHAPRSGNWPRHPQGFPAKPCTRRQLSTSTTDRTLQVRAGIPCFSAKSAMRYLMVATERFATERGFKEINSRGESCWWVPASVQRCGSQTCRMIDPVNRDRFEVVIDRVVNRSTECGLHAWHRPIARGLIASHRAYESAGSERRYKWSRGTASRFIALILFGCRVWAPRQARFTLPCIAA
jgi:hypothetical protein